MLVRSTFSFFKIFHKQSFPGGLKIWFHVWYKGKEDIQSSPFPKRQISDTSKLKEFADGNFKFNEDGTKFSRWVKNMVGKREIAHYEQIHLFQQCFRKTCNADTSKPGFVLERIKQGIIRLRLYIGYHSLKTNTYITFST